MTAVSIPTYLHSSNEQSLGTQKTKNTNRQDRRAKNKVTYVRVVRWGASDIYGYCGNRYSISSQLSSLVPNGGGTTTPICI